MPNRAARRAAGLPSKRDVIRQNRQFQRDLDHTVVFYAKPDRGFVAVEDPEGAYLMDRHGDQQQIIVAGKMKMTADRYCAAIGKFLKAEIKLVSSEPLRVPDGVTRQFTSIIFEVA